MTGTYQWDATYNGDGNNNPVSDNNAANEQVTVSAASPILVTTPGQRVVALGVSTVTLTDTALLSDGYHPTGAITFTLVAPGGGTVDTETVTVNGNGDYTTPTGYTLMVTGATTGTYQWNATHSGDRDNNAASDINQRQRAGNDQRQGRPDDHHHPQPHRGHAAGTPPGSVTLSELGGLSKKAASNPTGTITFMLVAPERRLRWIRRR